MGFHLGAAGRSSNPAQDKTAARRRRQRLARAKGRVGDTGPAYSKLGGRVVYRIADLQTWVALGARTSTSDVGVGVVHPAKARFRREGGA
jgi:hypothetical protein